MAGDAAEQTIDFANASPEMRSALCVDLNDLFLSVRTKNVLQLAGIRFMGELLPYDKAAVLALQNCGVKTVAELQDILDAFGLKFGTAVVGLASPETPSSSFLAEPAEEKSALASLPVLDRQTRARLRIKLSELDFSARASNIFVREGMEYVGDLVQRTEADLLKVEACGRLTIAEISEKLGKLGLALGMAVPAWNPQIVEREREADKQGQKSALDEAMSIASPLPETEYLEDELLGILATVAKDRDLDAIPKLLGWMGLGERTLDSVGQEFGVTRERIRQIKSRAIRKIQDRDFETPWLDKAVAVARSACPARPEMIAAKLKAEGVSRESFDPTGLAAACEVFEKKFGIVRTLIGQETVYEEEKLEGKGREILRLCKRLTSSGGCANFEAVCVEARIPEERRDAYRRIVDIDDTCEWLDDEHRWFMASDTTQNRLSNLVAKVLHVAPNVNLSELRRAVSKSRRLASVPPASVLAKFIEKMELARVEGNKVLALSTFPDALEAGGAEETMVRVLRANGPVLSIEKLQELCVAAGMNPITAGIYTSNSPVVARLARGVYALVGVDVVPGVVEEVAKELASSREGADWGWSAKGTLWCAVRLTRVSLTSGAATVPKFVSDYAEGEWQPEMGGSEIDATVKCRGGFMWGLKRPLANAGAEPGDVCVLEFVRSERTVKMMVGDEELVDLWENGEIDAATSDTLASGSVKGEDDVSEAVAE